MRGWLATRRALGWIIPFAVWAGALHRLMSADASRRARWCFFKQLARGSWPGMVRWRQLLLRLSSFGRWRFSVAYAGWVPVSAFQRGVVRQHWRRSRNWRSPRGFSAGLDAFSFSGTRVAGVGRLGEDEGELERTAYCTCVRAICSNLSMTPDFLALVHAPTSALPIILPDCRPQRLS